MGSKAYSIIKDYNSELSGSVVEIGSDRGEGSTLFLSSFCRDNKLKFYSVDFEKKAYTKASSINGTISYNCTGEEFLEKKWNDKESICFAYLDNFDYLYDVLYNFQEGLNLIKEQSEIYEKYGMKLNNDNSKKSHLIQAQLIEKITSNISFILFDDTWINEDGSFDGKGGEAIPFLIKKGYYVIKQNDNGAEKWESFVLMCRRVKDGEK